MTNQEPTNPLKPRRVVIIGGGITGMAAAYTLQTTAAAKGLPVEYTLVEAGPRLGGKIITEKVDGFTIEGGPDCFLRQKPWAAQLCHQLGIGGELRGTNDERRKTYVLNKGKLAPLPDGVMLIIPTRIMPFVTSTLISWPGKIRMGMDLFIPAKKDDVDESIGDFVRRRLGTEALDKIAEPLLSGIHVSDPEYQSLLGTFPRFRALEKNSGSLIRGMLAQRRAPKNGSHAPGPANAGPSSIFVTLRGGLGQMISTLEQALTGTVLTGTAAEAVETLPGGGYAVRLNGGRALQADVVLLASPAHASSALLRAAAPQLSEALAGIRYVSTATISLGFHKDELGHPLNGFGFVVPRKEKRKVSACTWVSTKFSDRTPDDGVLLRCFVGGPGHESMVDQSDESLIAIARAELAQTMGVTAQPVVTRIYRWRQANPQYDVGHLDRIKQMQVMTARHPGLFLAGSAYEGVGIPDCVHQGQQSAERIIQFLSER